MPNLRENPKQQVTGDIRQYSISIQTYNIGIISEDGSLLISGVKNIIKKNKGD